MVLTLFERACDKVFNKLNRRTKKKQQTKPKELKQTPLKNLHEPNTRLKNKITLNNGTLKALGIKTLAFQVIFKYFFYYDIRCFFRVIRDRSV